MKTPKLIETQKKSFATYAIMALNNAQTVLDHIQKIVGIETPERLSQRKNPHAHEEDLWEHAVMCYLEKAWRGYVKNDDIHFDEQILPEKLQTVIDKLFVHFPFLGIMAENQRIHFKKEAIDVGDIHYVLSNVFRVIKAYRDTTAHYKASTELFEDGGNFLINESKFAKIVDKYYTVALRKLAERYSYATKDLAFIQNHRFVQVYRNGKKKAESNLNFFLSLMAKNDDTCGDLHLSGVGVALLICLLLDKQYINLFLTKLPIFSKYGPQQEERRIIIRSMGICSVKIPKDRIHTEKDELSVAMDMLGELKKCPDELFDKLSAYSQARFRLISSDHNEVLMKRSSDRFAQLLLQYIDYGKLFSDIRFHVNMGKLRYLFNAEKNCIDGITRVRVIEHPLNGYGRIDEMEALRKTEQGTFADTGIAVRDFDNVQRDDAAPAKYPYIVDTYTHYILENNKVEMTFPGGCLMPRIEEEDGKWYVCKNVPDCRMSTLELPAMAFHMFLLDCGKTEERIKEVYSKYQTLFDAMRNGEVTKDNLHSFGIAVADLPQKVIDSINGGTRPKNVEQHIKKLIGQMLEDTERRIERLRDDQKAVMSKDNKMGKRGFRSISTGRLADFLAKDIVYMQPTKGDGTDKMTGLNYRVMQSAIATYNSNGSIEAKNSFKEMFNKAHLLGRDAKRNHPFLHNVFARSIPEDAIEFYAAYLAERRSYLNRLKIEMRIKKVEIPFVNKSSNKWKSIKQEALGEIYGEQLAIELPRHLFDDDIKECLKAMPQMSGVDFDNANTTFLIMEYMKRVLGDDCQEFYSMKRHYRYIDMLKCETDRKGSLCPTYTTTEEREKLWAERATLAAKYGKMALNKKQQTRSMGRRQQADNAEEAVERSLANARIEYQKTEKTIRRYKVQDALLFMLAKQTLTKTADFEGEEFKLREIMPDSDKGILSKPMAMTFRFTTKIKVKDKEQTKKYAITAGNMKLKNFGDFFALAYDKRFVTLMEIIGSDTVSKDQLSDEFKKYDQCRPEMVTLVLKLEERAYEECPSIKEKIDRDERSRFADAITELCNNGDFDEKQKEELKQIRNAFLHNSYPTSSVVEIHALPPKVALSLKETFEESTIDK